MSNYTQTTSFTPKDALLSGNPAKLIKGADYDVEFAAIAAAIATKLDSTNSANPGATIGLTAVNGSAGSYMRSDAAPALSQAIAPTWTGNHVFTPAAGVPAVFNGRSGLLAASFISGSSSVTGAGDIQVSRAGSTINTVQQGPNIVLNDSTNTALTTLQHSGGQSELWQFNGSWVQQWRTTSVGVFQARDQGGTMQDIGWRDCPQTLTSVNYTAVLSDRGKLIFTGSAGITFTIPSNASVAYPIGTVLTFATLGGAATIAINTDTMFLAGTATSGSRTLANSGLATAIKVTSTSWLISGAGLS